MTRRDVVVLGSTGSIGTQALDVCRANPDRFRVVGTMELDRVATHVRAVEPDLDIRLSVVFYRDRGDAFVTLSQPFTQSVDEAVSFMSTTSLAECSR